MAEYDVNNADVQQAAAVLRDILATENPTRDYSEGSVLGETVVDGHAIPYAAIRKQLEAVQLRLSIRDLSTLPDDEATRDAANALLSNYFVQRTPGKFAKGVVTIHYSQRVDSLLPRRTRFFKDSTLVFYPDIPEDRLIPATSLRPNVAVDGTVTDYVVEIPVTAAAIGSNYNVEAGRFLAVDPFSPFLVYAENVEQFQFGAFEQGTNDYIAAASDALSLRALVNARSNEAVLKGQEFPDIRSMLTVNYGDPEMQRDYATDPATGVALHVGGNVDIYVDLETQQVVERIAINTLQVRPDGLINILRDSAPPSGSFIAAGIVPGDILVVTAGIPEAGAQYVIREVAATSLTVSERVPFSIPTDESSTPIAVSYTIGNNYPSFNNKVTVAATVNAATSRRVQRFNQAMLSGRPVYRVKKVEIFNPPSYLDEYRDVVTGNVEFSERTNTLPVLPYTAGATLSYKVDCVNPNYGQSSKAVTFIDLGWASLDLSNLTLEVTYDTLAGFEPIGQYVLDDSNRTCGAFPLVKGFHPVYISLSLSYRGRVVPIAAPDTFVVSESTYSVNESAVIDAVLAYINSVPFGSKVDSGGIMTAAKQADPNIAAVYPPTITYELLAPNGKVYRYTSPDVVSVFIDPALSGAVLTNPTELGLPVSGYAPRLQYDLLHLGVSDRTVRFLSARDLISLNKVGV